MRAFQALFALTTLATLGACQQKPQADPLPAAELAFLDSLEFGLISPPAQNTVSAIELGLAAEEPDEAEASGAVAAAPVKKSASSTTRRSSSTSSSQGSVSPARQPRTVTVRHTKRDAAIGAGAGAVIGAVAGGPRNRVKGAVIGAVVGGAAGAVIGHTIDKETRVVY